MDTAAFLKSVVTTEEGFFNLLIGPPSGVGWREEWFNWPNDLPKIIEAAQAEREKNNVYFTSHLFETKNSSKKHVLPSRTIQADLDDAVVPTVNAPTIVVETSPNRHQGFWILEKTLQPEALEGLSKQLTYSIPEADRSGWSLGHKMRLPDTFNHKYPGGPRAVRVISSTLNVYKSLNLRDIAIPVQDPANDDWQPEPLTEGVRELWARLRGSVPQKVRNAYDMRQQDRSQALWALMQSLFRAGANRDQVFWLCKASANNKFADNRYHADLDLAKDVLRAERTVASGQSNDADIKMRISDARKLPGSQTDRRQYISALVRDDMQQRGTFVATTEGEWYVREDVGRPTTLSRNNDYLNAVLEMRYGLNATEAEQRYVIANLISTTKERGRPGQVGVLSYFDNQRKQLLVHSGRRDVYHIDAQGVSHVVNGNLGLIFPWRLDMEPFDPDLEDPMSIESLFEGCFDNLIEISEVHAMALMRTWIMFLLMRNAATARPILALFGQPGSGKSTLFRRIYALLYGGAKSVNSITSPEDFDHAVSTDPIVVFDNVDTWAPWLPDKLALGAANSDLTKRKLYTDNDTVTMRRGALLGITAHNPQFRREDIVDRLLMLNFHRLKQFRSETEIMTRIAANRDRLWGGLLLDAQRVLSTAVPREEEVPKFRVSDFATIGLWIARALGYEQDFIAALQANQTEQVSFNLEEEDLLVDTIQRWLDKGGVNQREWYSPSDLWARWRLATRDPGNFERHYRNALKLGRKLWALQETLSTVFNIEFMFEEEQGRRLWRITSK